VYNNNIAEFSVYCGIVLLCLIVAVWATHWREFLSGAARRICLYLFALCVVGWLLALGRWGGLFIFLGAVPAVSEFRCAARYICFVQFGCAGLGAFAMSRVLRGGGRFGWRVLVPIPAAAVGLTIVGAVVGGRLSGTPFAVSRWPWLLAGPLFAGAGAGVLALCGRVRVAPALLAGLCLADLGLFGLRIIVPVEEIALSEVGKLYRAYEDPPPVNAELRLWAPANSGVWKGLYLANGYCGMPPDEPLQSEPDPDQAIRLASVGMLWTPNGWVNVTDALMRFRLVGRVVRDTPENRDADVAKTARVDDPGRPLPSVEPGSGTVRLLSETPTHLELAVECDTDQLLVCSDRFDADWHAAVDGDPVRLLPLYGRALRGVVVPSGRHRVTMAYWSRSFFAGCILTCSGVLFAVAVCVWCVAKRSP
jgi:hypothetical protein